MSWRRWLTALPLVGFGACAGSAARTEPLPDWRGPVVHCRHLGDRGLSVELTAPTAGHAFQLVDVQVNGERADVHFTHRGPQAELVAQVVTPHRIDVRAERLGNARAVWIWVASGGAAEQLAIATARP
jgi:hypothetical protein